MAELNIVFKNKPISMLPNQMQQEKYHYFRTKYKKGIQFETACGNEKM